MGYQTMATFCITLWTMVTSFLFLQVIDVTLGLRVSPREETLGSDIVEHGVKGQVYGKSLGQVIEQSALGSVSN